MKSSRESLRDFDVTKQPYYSELLALFKTEDSVSEAGNHRVTTNRRCCYICASHLESLARRLWQAYWWRVLSRVK